MTSHDMGKHGKFKKNNNRLYNIIFHLQAVRDILKLKIRN